MGKSKFQGICLKCGSWESECCRNAVKEEKMLSKAELKELEDYGCKYPCSPYDMLKLIEYIKELEDEIANLKVDKQK